MSKIRTLRLQELIRNPNYLIRTCTNYSQISADEAKEREIERIAKDASIDNPPTSCCQSGCSNCVFIVWAEAISAKMKDAGPEVSEKILKRVEDPSLKAYLEMELRLRGLNK